MGRAKPVEVGRRFFPRQLDAINHFSEILASRQLGDEISEGADFEDLQDLLSLHRDCITKIGVGLKAFVVMVSPEGSKCFGVRRNDGTTEDFSFHRCVKQNW